MLCARCTRPTETDPCEHCQHPAILDGRYQLDAVLGRGTSGTTWRAIGPDETAVAIKSIPLVDVGGPKERELVEREVRVLRTLEHPGIPAYVEHLVLGEHPDTTLWLVQELVPGVSLAQEQEDHRYTPREVLEIVAELAGILSYLHELSPPVIHRDVKPGNVMRRPDGSLALVDFGAVRDVAKGSLGGSTVAGTFGYMAPEQFAGDAEPRSDLYGLGALAVALLTRKEPQSLSDHANRLKWSSHAQVPPGIHDLVNRMVEPEIERRAPAPDGVELRARPQQARAPRVPTAPLPPDDPREPALAKKPRGAAWWILAASVALVITVVPVSLALHGADWIARNKLVDPEVTLPSPPTFTEPREERPLMQRADAGADEHDPRPLQRIVSTLGEDAAIQACVAEHQQDHPDAAVQLEVTIVPPNEVTDVDIGPASLAGSELARCLERAALRVAFRGVELERAGSVTLQFD